MEPLIVFSELGKRWYVVTRYINRGGGNILVQKKYDVTNQMERILNPNPGPNVPDEVIDEIDNAIMDAPRTKAEAFAESHGNRVDFGGNYY